MRRFWNKNQSVTRIGGKTMETRKIRLDESIFDLVNKYPEIKEVLFELGFKDIVKPGMIQTVGKFMNLKKGAASKKMNIEEIARKLVAHGFDIEK